jgi:hypothetical protein
MEENENFKEIRFIAACIIDAVLFTGIGSKGSTPKF